MITKPQLKAVPVAEQRPSQPAPFITDAEKFNLPTVNVRDRDAPVLDVDAVLRRTEMDQAKDTKQ